MPSSAWEQFKFGLFFGIGFLCAYGLMVLIVFLVNAIAGRPHNPFIIP
jgi:hypothetical protein